MRNCKLQIAVLFALIFFVLGLRLFLLPVTIASLIIARCGYWIMFGSVLLFAWQIWVFIKKRSAKHFFIKYKWGLIIALCGTLFLEANEPRQFKVLFDEFTISSVAQNMHFSREAIFTGRAHYVNDRLEIFNGGLDKRPLLFQFVLSCVHDIMGYRPENVFILNGFCAFLLLFISYYIGSQYGGARLGVACVGLWLMLPLLAQCATSGGYDIFNVLMAAVVWYFAREYLRDGDADSQNILILSVIHLAQVRYESILFVIAIALIVLARWWRDKRIELGWAATLSPLFLFLPLLINYVFVHNPAAFENDPGQSFFSLEYFIENVGHAVWYLFNPDISATNSFWLSMIGGCSLVAFGVKVLLSRKTFFRHEGNIAIVSIGLVIFANVCLVLCNFWGQWDDPIASRFSLPLHLLFIFCFCAVIQDALRGRATPRWLPVTITVLAIAVSVPASAQSRATRQLWQGREYTWLFEQIENPAHKGALIITKAIGPILYNHPAIDLPEAEANKWKVSECIKNRIYPEILVLERFSIDPKTMEERPYSEDRSLDYRKAINSPEGVTALSPVFKKEKVAEIRLRANVISRLSRIIAVDGSDAVPPKAYLEEGPPFKDVGAYLRHVYSSLP